MKIDREDTPQSGDGKRTLAADVAKFQSEYASLHERYVGYRFDAAYRREIERLYAELDVAVRSAPAIASAGEAASLIDLEIRLFQEFEGGARGHSCDTLNWPGDGRRAPAVVGGG
ncbi:hypothetical protein GBZ48_17915 [Azospirillum melinis]|uniref:Uncharacterized protein n=1 Tax=Azospirillum melinis TaxID=328839 RepID=A0ABX2KH87_9PROT|nr:hypothetical protein [Azospirillum melinis]MBP2304581.1 hypothetical protein [Azospirillum melinis]NUB01148.1 hypothetical protein [Azospirillum melinis]